jgi:ankyrin repeat protein
LRIPKASLWGLKEIVHILLQGGADVNHLGGKYGSSLQAACACGDQNYTAGWDSDAQTYQGTVQLLLAAGADVNQQGGKYGSALEAAMAWELKGDIVQLLLEAGATPVDARDVPSPLSAWGSLRDDPDQFENDADGESDSDNIFTDSDQIQSRIGCY